MQVKPNIQLEEEAEARKRRIIKELRELSGKFWKSLQYMLTK